ncbi:hypothetical protein CH371_19850 [Leptospira wolffii]|uniref:SH3b domain-containing protein n=1 Tax=Leptospira wolffii TaxID=409998 RepID=A0A2M9Z6R8_9LEPT|nr:SH3 domain-containing protein [Leptospira wolffii]PJZ64120.1 hypothetical protein CH371_19850 [Leptospira wolffii]
MQLLKIITLIPFCYIAACKPIVKEQIVPVASKCVFMDGLKVRQFPELNANHIGYLNYGQVVDIVRFSDRKDTINQVQASWALINFKGIDAWIFAGFLRDNCPTEATKLDGLIKLKSPGPIFTLMDKNFNSYIGNIYKNEKCSLKLPRECFSDCSYEAGGGSCSIISSEVSKDIIVIKVRAYKEGSYFKDFNGDYICRIENSEFLIFQTIICSK